MDGVESHDGTEAEAEENALASESFGAKPPPSPPASDAVTAATANGEDEDRNGPMSMIGMIPPTAAIPARAAG